MDPEYGFHTTWNRGKILVPSLCGNVKMQLKSEVLEVLPKDVTLRLNAELAALRGGQVRAHFNFASQVGHS